MGAKAFYDSPVIGLSYNDIYKLEDRMINQGEAQSFVKKYFHFHDDLLNSLGHFGIIGGLSLLSLWVMLFRFYKKNSELKEKINIHIKYIMFSVFGIFIVSSLTDAYLFGSTSPTLILLFVCSIIYSIKVDKSGLSNL